MWKRELKIRDDGLSMLFNFRAEGELRFPLAAPFFSSHRGVPAVIKLEGLQVLQFRKS